MHGCSRRVWEQEKERNEVKAGMCGEKFDERVFWLGYWSGFFFQGDDAGFAVVLLRVYV